jgi:hypothetical protein
MTNGIEYFLVYITFVEQFVIFIKFSAVLNNK